jgi:hypothetical protein
VDPKLQEILSELERFGASNYAVENDQDPTDFLKSVAFLQIFRHDPALDKVIQARIGLHHLFSEGIQFA